MQKFTTRKYHGVPPGLSDFLKQQDVRGKCDLDCSPAAGIIAAFNFRDTGTSRRRLSEKATPVAKAEEEGAMSRHGRASAETCYAYPGAQP